MEETTSIVETLTRVVRLLVDKPDEVDISTSESQGRIALRILVAPEDIGKVIGRQGRTARSLRILGSAMGMAANIAVSLEIVDDVRVPEW